MSKRTVEFNTKRFLWWGFLSPLVLGIIMTMIQRGNIVEGLTWTISHPIQMIWTYALLFSILHVFLFISKKKVYIIFNLFVSFLLLLLTYISYVKTDLRGEPLSILDGRLLKEATNISDSLDTVLFIPAILLIFLFLFFVFLGWTRTNLLISKKTQFSFAAFSLFCLIFAYSINTGTMSKMKISIPADTSWNHDNNGFLLATLVDTKFLHIPVPKGYNKQAIKSIYEKMDTKNKELSPTEQPNILFVMSESFMDLSVLDGLTFNQDPTPNFHALSESNSSGKISVPGIGGGTANTEFEVLTGFSSKFIKNYVVPYNPYNNYLSQPVRTMATILSESEYTATAIHPYQSWFYRRSDIYKQLGFKQFLSLETMKNEPEIKGMFASDAEVYSLIDDKMKSTPTKDFIYTVTMQGHGPYQDMTAPEEGIRVTSELPAENKKVIETYANNIHNVDAELAHLIDTLKESKEPTVLVFFGDHIAPFGTDIYNQLGFDMKDPAAKKAPVLIWRNDQTLTERFDLKANMLGSYVMNLLDVHDPYMDYLWDYSSVSPTITPEDDPELYHDFELLHYDIMHGEQYLYEFTSSPAPNDEFQLGEKLKIEKVVAHEEEQQYVIDILGKGIGWMSSIFVNDAEFETVTLDGVRATISIPKDEWEKEKELRFAVKTIDSRKTIMLTSNTITVGSIKDLLKEYSSYKTLLEPDKIKITTNPESIVAGHLFNPYEGQSVIGIHGEGFTENSMIYANGTAIYTDWNDANYLTALLPSSYYEKSGFLSIKVTTRDEKGRVIEQSDVTRIPISNHPLNKELLLNKGLSLNDELTWEFFDQGDGYKIVRTPLGSIPQEFVVTKEKTMLNQQEVDLMRKGNLSHIYANGYLYLSINNSDSHWYGKRIPKEKQIKRYFKNQDYTLYTN